MASPLLELPFGVRAELKPNTVDAAPCSGRVGLNGAQPACNCSSQVTGNQCAQAASVVQRPLSGVNNAEVHIAGANTVSHSTPRGANSSNVARAVYHAVLNAKHHQDAQVSNHGRGHAAGRTPYHHPEQPSFRGHLAAMPYTVLCVRPLSLSTCTYLQHYVVPHAPVPYVSECCFPPSLHTCPAMDKPHATQPDALMPHAYATTQNLNRLSAG